MLALVDTLNNQLGIQGLDQRTLQNVFGTYWPQFESNFNIILETIKPDSETNPREDTDILAEILANTRSLSTRIARLESKRDEKEIVSVNNGLMRRNIESLVEEWSHMKVRGFSSSEIKKKINELEISDKEKYDLIRIAYLNGILSTADLMDDKILHSSR